MAHFYCKLHRATKAQCIAIAMLLHTALHWYCTDLLHTIVHCTGIEHPYCILLLHTPHAITDSYITAIVQQLSIFANGGVSDLTWRSPMPDPLTP